jgi:hypothetical protein
MRLVKSIAFVLTLGVLFSSCGPNPNQAFEEDNLLGHDKMVNIIYDMSLVEAAWRGRLYSDTLAEAKANQRVAHICEKHNDTLQEFNRSYEGYVEHPEKMKEILNEVLARYNTRISEIEEEVE